MGEDAVLEKRNGTVVWGRPQWFKTVSVMKICMEKKVGFRETGLLFQAFPKYSKIIKICCGKAGYRSNLVINIMTESKQH